MASFVAEGSLLLPVTPEVAFDVLADFGSWREWMPRSFIPVSKNRGPLRAGDRIWVKVGGLPIASPLRLTVVERAREITWTGGPRGILHADHRFLFESRAEGTLVRSIETWRGALASLIEPILLPRAEDVAREQLAGLERAVQSARA